MTALVDLQRQMAAAIRRPARALPMDVFRPDHLPEGDPLSVYANHHQISLCAALATTFPTVSLLVGEEAFRVLASRFLQCQPPVRPCLAEYGADFGTYLDGEMLVKSLPYLADMARLDWAINRATTAPEAVALDMDMLGALTAEQLAELSLQAHPSLTLLRSDFSLPDIYRFAHGAETAEAITLKASETRLMIWRQNGTAKTTSVSPDVFEALEALIRGEKLASACERLPPSELPDFFSQQILAGGFVRR
ncbi:MAG: putative DNA-binding domain-containing protein [Rhodospirillaceae bacterium]|nr:putative DNA-binding domain-containing protein [Rhodospirillaceae bacterium]